MPVNYAYITSYLGERNDRGRLTVRSVCAVENAASRAARSAIHGKFSTAVTSPSMARTTGNEAARRFEAGTNGAASAYKHICGTVGPVGVGQNSMRRLIRAPQGPIWEDRLVRPLAIAALGALHRARAVLPTPQGCDRCSRIRKSECERLACKAAPFCGVLALARPSTSPIRRDRRVGYPNTKLRERRTARRRPQQSPIRSPGSAPGIL